MVLVAGFDVVDEDFRGEEDGTELALHGLGVFEDSLEYLDVRDFLLQLLAPTLHLSYCFGEHFVRQHHLRVLLFLLIASVVYCCQ